MKSFLEENEKRVINLKTQKIGCEYPPNNKLEIREWFIENLKRLGAKYSNPRNKEDFFISFGDSCAETIGNSVSYSFSHKNGYKNSYKNKTFLYLSILEKIKEENS